jgi:hypothetical protein
MLVDPLPRETVQRAHALRLLAYSSFFFVVVCDKSPSMQLSFYLSLWSYTGTEKGGIWWDIVSINKHFPLNAYFDLLLNFNSMRLVNPSVKEDNVKIFFPRTWYWKITLDM